MKKFGIFLFLVVMLVSFKTTTPGVGSVIDRYNGVNVYYNGNNFKMVLGRNVTNDGYNLGLKYQCVEFVKRYYYEYFGHKMPNSYGHAKDFFDESLPDVAFNEQRGLWQYRNVREESPKVDDILVYGGHPGNPYGHVAIISKVGEDFIEIVQQNKGKKTRERIMLDKFMNYYTVADYNVKGWLRK